MQIKKKKQPASIEMISAKSPAENPVPTAKKAGSSPLGISAITQLKSAKKVSAKSPADNPQKESKSPADNPQEEAIVDSESRAKYKARLKQRIK